jgi:DNA end-binding protein Ku
MRGKEVVALARIVLNKREHVLMIQPWEDGLLATTLHYAYEVRPAKTAFSDIQPIKIDPELRELAERLIEQRAGKFEPETFQDRYEDALKAMLDKKRAGVPIPKDRPSGPASGKVVNLMEALRNSIKSEGATARRKSPPLQPKAPPSTSSGYTPQGQRTITTEEAKWARLP